MRRPRLRFDVVFYMPHIGPLLESSGSRTTGGAETQIFLLACELGRRGYEVGLISFPLDERRVAKFEGISLIMRDRDRGQARAIGKLLELAAIWRSLKSVRSHVLVQRSAGFTTGAVAIVALIRRMRFVYSSANVFDFRYARFDPVRRNRALFHLGVRLAESIIVQTAEQASMCQEVFDRKGTLIRSIAEPADVAGPVGEAFLWVGRLTWYKRPYEYIELARAVPEASFWMIAPSEADYGALDADELAQAAAAVPNLKLLPPRPRDELMTLLTRAVAVVNTSEYEGMSNIFLEAWARGVPALALFHDPDGVIEQERLGAFAAGSHDALVHSASLLWSERHNRAEISARCRQYVRREHSITAVTDKWIEALRLRRIRDNRDRESRSLGRESRLRSSA